MTTMDGMLKPYSNAKLQTKQWRSVIKNRTDVSHANTCTQNAINKFRLHQREFGYLTKPHTFSHKLGLCPHETKDSAPLNSIVLKPLSIRHCTSPITQLICPPKFCITLVFHFSLGITAVPREIENNAYAKFWGQIRCILGDVQVVNNGSRSTSPRIQIKNKRFQKYPDSCGHSFTISVKKVFLKKLSQNPLSIEEYKNKLLFLFKIQI